MKEVLGLWSSEQLWGASCPLGLTPAKTLVTVTIESRITTVITNRDAVSYQWRKLLLDQNLILHNYSNIGGLQWCARCLRLMKRFMEIHSCLRGSLSNCSYQNVLSISPQNKLLQNEPKYPPKKSEYSPNNSYLMVMAEYTLFLSPTPVPCYTDTYWHHCLVGSSVGFFVGLSVSPYRGEGIYYKVGYT